MQHLGTYLLRAQVVVVPHFPCCDTWTILAVFAAVLLSAVSSQIFGGKGQHDSKEQLNSQLLFSVINNRRTSKKPILRGGNYVCTEPRAWRNDNNRPGHRQSYLHPLIPWLWRTTVLRFPDGKGKNGLLLPDYIFVLIRLVADKFNLC